MVLNPDSRAEFELLAAALTEFVRNGSVGGARTLGCVALLGLRILILPPLYPALYGVEETDSEIERQ